MEGCLKGNGKMEKLMEKEKICLKMGRFMKDNMLMIKKRVLEYFILMKIKNMLGNGKMIFLMGMVL
jgi:hypothetical protein